MGKISKDWITAHADNLRAAEVCAAEATELPVWKRPPVSVANGFCHPQAAADWGYGARLLLVWWLFQKTGSRVKHALARDDTVYSLVVLVSGLGGSF